MPFTEAWMKSRPSRISAPKNTIGGTSHSRTLSRVERFSAGGMTRIKTTPITPRKNPRMHPRPGRLRLRPMSSPAIVVARTTRNPRTIMHAPRWPGCRSGRSLVHRVHEVAEQLQHRAPLHLLRRGQLAVLVVELLRDQPELADLLDAGE